MMMRISRGGLRKITTQEELLITKIVNSGNYFSDKHNNLYLLKVLNDYAEILFVRSKVTNIDLSKKQGYYEPNYQVYEPVTELFGRIPKRR